ncbi:hypothetical protein EYF80_053479 [Liparis tanakae]|uniref:Uncharacterized protein n=1 Tax=Liparis tanakae TaxID=230148 RepID=A0A4Z2F5K2_9TELE|nr:hypothetical protein EYF80_053479 [Liparis tanakae]
MAVQSAARKQTHLLSPAPCWTCGVTSTSARCCRYRIAFRVLRRLAGSSLAPSSGGAWHRRPVVTLNQRSVCPRSMDDGVCVLVLLMTECVSSFY